ncbi:exodeoxyribonuclease I [Vibrio sp. RC27]
MPSQEQSSFFFFDYETWGTSPALDRPSQFAGVRTDMDFNIIGEPLVIYCQPPMDYLPNPEAVLITGITPQKAVQEGLPEPEFIRLIHQEMAKPQTINLGYNNIRFDDEVTRYTCYRNFIDPYSWAWKNNNSRWDLLDVLRACHALRPEGIVWPDNEEGYPSFKLEHLSIANDIEHENAHDAMADVIATIEMAKKIKQAQPKLFDYFLSMRHKKALTPLIDIVNLTPLLHVSGMFGRERNYTSWIVPFAWHPTNNNAVIVVDLSMDPTPLLTLDADEIRQRLYTKRQDLAADELPIPVKLVHLNKCPILAPAKTLTAENAHQLGIDRSKCLENLNTLKANQDVRSKLTELFSQQEDYPKSENVDTQLYNGFFTPADRSAMDIILDTQPELLGQLDIQFNDQRIKPLLVRYRARNYPSTLTQLEQQQWASHCRDYFDQNIDSYFMNLEQLAEQYQSDEKKLSLLKSVYHYVSNLVS